MKETATVQPWIFCPKPNPAARLRLFCVPYAGCGASIYRSWPELLGGKIELCALQLPGRENRLREAPFTRLLAAVDEAADILQPYLDLPFALFGHSMGAVICFELACLLRRQRRPAPVHLFVSGRRAPQFPDPRALMTPLSNELFAAEICRRYNGIPAEVLKDRELMDLLLPTLRADVEMLETHNYEPGPRFDFPITAFGGQNDTETSLDELAGWREQTNAQFESKIYSGDHFFLQSAAPQMLEIIRRKLESVFLGP